ncbi:MAG: glycosyltransferase [Planctomycetota bacterium]
MTRPVSIVIPSLGDVAQLERALAALRAEVQARGVEDQILVVDDTGKDVLRRALDVGWPDVRVHPRKLNGGFGAAAFDGAQAADYRLMFLMHPDVIVRPGALTALVDALADDGVFAASPRVLEGGGDDRAAARRGVALEDGRLALHDVSGALPVDEEECVPIAFAPACAMLVRREEFIAMGGFDRFLAPLHFEDVDLGLTAWRRGRRVVEVPLAVVEHHSGGTLNDHVPPALSRAAMERNRLLVQWKHLSTKREAHDHLVSLWRDALDAGITGRREDLVHLALALRELDAVGAARSAMADARIGLEAALALGQP